MPLDVLIQTLNHLIFTLAIDKLLCLIELGVGLGIEMRISGANVESESTCTSFLTGFQYSLKGVMQMELQKTLDGEWKPSVDFGLLE